MTEPKEPNHWERLASQLGATPPPTEEKGPGHEAAEKQQGPEAQAPAHRPGKAPSIIERKPRPPRPPANWLGIAHELGIEVPAPEPATPATPEAAEAEPERAESLASRERPAGPPASPALPGSLELEAEPPEAADETRRTDLVPAGAEVDLPGFLGGLPAVSAEKEHEEEQEERASSRKRRKRRHKPKRMAGGAASEGLEEAPATEWDEEAAEEPAPTRPPGESATIGESIADAEPKERSKRHRRRRGSGRKKESEREEGETAHRETREARAAEPDLAAAGKGIASEATGPKPGDAQLADDDRKQAKGAASRPSKAGHRGIPTWEEAVGMVIAANMESRAKRPGNAPSSRPRSGRSQAGRDKPRDKSR
jgi:hypothetical protein